MTLQIQDGHKHALRFTPSDYSFSIFKPFLLPVHDIVIFSNILY